MNETQDRLLQWTSRCSIAIGDAFDLCKPIFAADAHKRAISSFVLPQLGISCHLTSESALILVGNVRVWDADILVRSVVEGTLKFVYLGTGDDEARKAKAAEYWDTLPDIGQMKRHKRASQLLGAVDDPDADQWRPIRDLLMEQTKFDQLQQKYPKKARQSIEQRWSFAELGQAIAKENPGTGLDLLKHLMHGYGMASHQAHQDADAIGMIWERFQREGVQYESVQAAHGARAISDIFVMAVIRAMVLHKLHGKDRKPVIELFQREDAALLAEMRDYQAEWHEVEYGTSARAD